MEYNEEETLQFTKWKLEKEIAETVHADNRAAQGRTFDAAIQFSLEAMRTAVIVNGGAVIAIFAFLGATFSAEGKDAAQIREALLTPALLFSLGATLSGIASGWAYFSQALFSNGDSMVTYHWDRPFIRDTEERDVNDRWARFFQALSVAFVIAGYGCLLIGLYTIKGVLLPKL